MTYKDYMELSKETLARELERRDSLDEVKGKGGFPSWRPPCYEKDGLCTNPHHDCINCPKTYSGYGEMRTNTAI